MDITIACQNRRTTGLAKSVQKRYTNIQGELLAGKGVYEGFKYARETGGFESDEIVRKGG